MAEVQPEKQLHELLSRSMVDIYVGPENTHWVLHEKLLCYRSPFFRKVFYGKNNTTKSFGLPDEEDVTFKCFIGWLYSTSLPVPREESDLGTLFDLYLMGEKFQIPALVQDVLQVVREWYKFSDSYPGLRRVQYIYANTESGSPMRHMLVHSVARLMVLEKGIPQHWDKALRKNGQLAVDIILAIQEWRLEDELVPDARDDPAEAEEMLEDEVKEAEEQNELANEADGEADPEADDSEDTVVDSPVRGKNPEVQGSNKKGDDQSLKKPQSLPKKGADQSMKKKGDDLSKGMGKLGLQQVPNGITNGDYGTLH